MKSIFYRSILVSLLIISATASLLACTCFPRQTFCEMFNPDTFDGHRVYRASIIDYVDVPVQPGYSVPTMRVSISEVLYGPDDLGTDTLVLIGQDGVNCATAMPIQYDQEIIFLIEYLFGPGEHYLGFDGISAELSGCGPSYLNVENNQVFGPIGGNLSSGVSIAEFIQSLNEDMGDCALSVDVEEPELDPANFQTYPNPATDLLSVTIGEQRAVGQMELITLTGQRLSKQSFTNATNQLQFPVANLPAGLYFLRITTANGGQLTQKVIVK